MLAIVKHLDNVGMMQLADLACFLDQSNAPTMIERWRPGSVPSGLKTRCNVSAAPDHLYRDRAIRTRIDRLEDDSHSTPTKFIEDIVMTDSHVLPLGICCCQSASRAERRATFVKCLPVQLRYP